ncbi:fructosamine kinase family protein [Actinophytocola algeriensis]|uniref:Fructosamine-3-kinase n=1 Tax=Actinophytocola algeriensis TaxID=1768010 RepID=A0A7W7QD54_9PSEU|nr:fructosamine kinase family protein [Actinophytocola algeriensis]MBB4911447.1 fructosamine-3-kinase [Actinophytocola algeriensis]MBE1479386.1 fructosamine-3-kinase [Actinophytocola algeriensis]
MDPRAPRLSGLLGQDVTGATPLGGAYRLRLADGTDVVAKRHDHESGVLAEAAGLRWLTGMAASTGDPGFRCPQVVAHDGEWLVIEAVPTGPATTDAAETFGRGLAGLHRAGAGAFGTPPPGGPVDAWIGLAPMRNETGTSWAEWYVAHRVQPYLRTAVDRGALHDHGPIDTVCERLADLAGPTAPPARLHGDLWSGNVLWGADGQAWLIDPAAHGGHRETDLAMLHLFGCPHLDRIVAAYDEADPLADGWRARIPLHQLFPLLVHTVLFGGGYGAQAVAAATAALSGL